MGEQEIEFQFTAPEIDPTISAIANTALRIACLPDRLAQENRTLVDHLGGRPENVAEHSLMLAIVAPAIAEVFYPDLDPNLVARYATVHDVVEAYVGDTPTHNFATVDHQTKANLETKGVAKLKADYEDLPKFISLVEDYEAQEIPEARFVRVADKLMPLLKHFQDGGATLRSYETKKKLLQTPSARNIALREHYSEFELLIQLREELTALAAERLFEE